MPALFQSLPILPATYAGQGRHAKALVGRSEATLDPIDSMLSSSGPGYAGLYREAVIVKELSK